MMDKPTEELRKLMAVTYSEKLNIYALLNKIQNQTQYSISPEVVERICKTYLKYKHRIKSPWAWGEKVAKLIRDDFYIMSKTKEEKEAKQPNVELLQKLLGGLLGKNQC